MIDEEMIRWRAMESSDLSGVKVLADDIHASYPEDKLIFEGRFFLYPKGCLVLMADNALSGYCIAHPWRFGHLPVLNTLLRALPIDADTLYLHDLALASTMRGKGMASNVISILSRYAITDGLPNISLTAVNGSKNFWAKNDFYCPDNFKVMNTIGRHGAAACFMMRPLGLG